MVLMLPDHDNLIKLPSVVTLPEVNPTQGNNDTFYDLLLMQLKSCITLSCTLNGIESLLCSVMFEPTVPCKLVEAHSLGLTDVFESNPPNVTLLMAKSCPRISLLWLAAARLNRVNRIWASIKGGMPQISLPMASWTGTLQSFVQARYILPENQGYISRAYEFGISYLTRPNVVVPFTHNPPFGITVTSNLGLDVRDHLYHDHRPLRYETFWILKTGDEFSAQNGSGLIPHMDLILEQTTLVDSIDTVDPRCATHIAHRILANTKQRPKHYWAKICRCNL